MVKRKSAPKNLLKLMPKLNAKEKSWLSYAIHHWEGDARPLEMQDFLRDLNQIYKDLLSNPDTCGPINPKWLDSYNSLMEKIAEELGVKYEPI